MPRLAAISATLLLIAAACAEPNEAPQQATPPEHVDGEVIAVNVAAPELGPQPRQAPDVLYFGYTTPAESAKATFDQCKDSGSPKCANTFTIYYAPGGAVSHWGLSVVCSGKGVNETATCFHDAALAAGGSPMWP
jgi:hypothetical protein